MKSRRFAEIYCAENRLPPERYAEHLFARALYPHARMIAWLINWMDGDYFTPDRDFVSEVGELTQYGAFVEAKIAFGEHPLNHGFMRNALLLRISTDRMKQSVRSVFYSKTKL